MSKLSTMSLKTYSEVSEKFKELCELSEAKTNGAFLELLLENYENPRKVEVSKKEDLEKIAEYEAIIEQKSDEYDKFLIERKKEAQEYNDLVNKYNELQERTPEKVEVEKELAENELITTVHPLLMHILKELAAIESKKKGREITPQWILIDMFWKNIQNPTVNHLQKTYTSHELKRLKKIYEQVQ